MSIWYPLSDAVARAASESRAAWQRPAAQPGGRGGLVESGRVAGAVLRSQPGIGGPNRERREGNRNVALIVQLVQRRRLERPAHRNVRGARAAGRAAPTGVRAGPW